MKIAVNYSKALVSLLARVPGLPIDYVKGPTSPFPGCWYQFEDPEINFPRLPHLAQLGVIFLGHPDPAQRFNLETVMRVLQCTKPPYLSTHLEAKVDFFPDIQTYQHENHLVVRKTLRSHFLTAICEVKDKVNLPLVLENFPYYSWWKHFRWGSEPEFIKDICHQSDSGFLLDIAHARCSAWHMHRDLLDYIQALPLDRLREIHLGGVLERPLEGLRDTHTPLIEDDYRLLDFLLSKIRPDMITIEYGGLPDKLMNLKQEYEPLARNSPAELETMIYRVHSIMKAHRG
jgi:uncharacterized protein (UPF0276 family)